MEKGDEELMAMVQAIAFDSDTAVLRRIASAPALAKARFARGATRHDPKAYFFVEFGYIYQGHTALHVAASVYRSTVGQRLVAAGADVRAKNRHGAEPIHLAAVGVPGSQTWNPPAQVAMIAYLIEAGADPNACDMRGVTPLHIAVRTRCSAAVRALLAAGADPTLKNRNGSTPMRLATRSTGRGGSGSQAAKEEQARIIELLAHSTK